MIFLGIKMVFMLFPRNKHIIHQHIRVPTLESKVTVTANKSIINEMMSKNNTAMPHLPPRRRK